MVRKQSAKLGVHKDGLFASAFGSDRDSPLCQVDIPNVQSNQRAESHPGAKQQREHAVVSARNCTVASGNRGEQHLGLIARQEAWRSSASRCRTDEPCGVLAEVTGIVEKAEEDPQGRLGSIHSKRSLSSVPVGEESGKNVGLDSRHLHVPAKPALELP